MSEHIFSVRAGLPPHMVVKLGWNAYSKSFFMAYLGEGSDDPRLWTGGLMHNGSDAAELCLMAHNYSDRIPADFARHLEADRRAEEEAWMEEARSDDASAPHFPSASTLDRHAVADMSLRGRIASLFPRLLGRPPL